MKHLVLTLGLLALTLGAGHAQTKPKPRPAAPAAPAAPVAPAKPAGKPKYAGFLINDKLVSEVDCYGFDRAIVVYPFFGPLNTCDRFRVAVVAGSYDKDHKFVREYSHRIVVYEGAALDAIREQYAERGYGMAEATDLLASFNANRNKRTSEDYVVDQGHPAFNILKYTRLPAELVPQSVIYFEIVSSKITSYDTKYSEYDKAVVSTPAYTSVVLYTSPKIPLLNREQATVAAPPLKARQKLANIGKSLISGGSGEGDTNGDFPVMQDEHCAFKGRDLTVEQVQEVPLKGYGETMTITN